MIKINYDLERDCFVTIWEKKDYDKVDQRQINVWGYEKYPDWNYIGTCWRWVEFLDIRVQIRNLELTSNRYFFEFRGKTYGIDIDGELEEHPDGMWDLSTELLCQLI